MMTDGARTVVQTLTVIVVLAIGCIWWNWDWVSARSIRSDLNEYSRSVRRSMLDLEDKTKLLDEIDSLKLLLQDGATVSQWGETDEAIRDLIRYIDDDDAILISRELKRARREMEQP